MYYLDVLCGLAWNLFYYFHPNTIIEYKTKGYARIKYIKDGEVYEVFVKLKKVTAFDKLHNIYTEPAEGNWKTINLQDNLVQGVDVEKYLVKIYD